MLSKYPLTSEALDDDVIDDGAAGVWCSGSGDELLMAVAVAAFVLEDIVDDDEDEEGKMCSAWLPFRDAGPVWRSIMRRTKYESLALLFLKKGREGRN